MADIYGSTRIKKAGAWSKFMNSGSNIYVRNDGEDEWGTASGEQGHALVHVRTGNNWIRVYPNKISGPDHANLLWSYDFMQNNKIDSHFQTYEGSFKYGSPVDIIKSEGPSNSGNGTKAGPTWTRDPDKWIYGWYDFDGTNDYIEIVNNSGNKFTYDPNAGLSVSAWVQSDNNHNGIIVSGDDPTARARVFQLKKKSTGKWLAICFKNNTVNTIPATYDGSNNTWTHLCFTAVKVGTTSTVKLYINGSLVDTETYSGTMTGSGGKAPGTVLGMQETGDNDNPFNGKIATVRCWDTDLSATEVQEDYSHFATHRFGH